VSTRDNSALLDKMRASEGFSHKNRGYTKLVEEESNKDEPVIKLPL
jgi:hypothetical protein